MRMLVVNVNNLILTYKLVCYNIIIKMLLHTRGEKMEMPVSVIGNRLREIRVGRNLSLDDLAKITEVSKPMLGQIERGQSVPTITTLWKIATGLKLPLSLFLEEPKAEYFVADIGKDVISEDDGRMRAHPLFTYDPIRCVETFYIEFDKGCCHTSNKHNEGVEEYIFVVQGKLQLVLNGKEVIVNEKQAVRFRADITHEYNNPFENSCIVYNTIFYPKY